MNLGLRRLRSWLLFASLAFILPNSAPAQSATAMKYALLIGVDKYEHAEMNGAEPLKYAVADVREFAQFLRDSGYQEVELLVGQRASLANIQEKLKLIKSKGNADGVVLVALAGHGVQFEKDDDAYYCPFDADMRESIRNGEKVLDRGGRPIQEPTRESCLKLTEILDRFEGAKAGTRILLGDLCRNDPTTGRGRGVGSRFRVNMLPDNTAMMLSCSADQKSYEDDRWKHGAFFYHVLKGLRVGHDTVSKLDGYLEESVPAEVRGLRDAPRQTPFTLRIGGRLDFGIARPTSTNPAPPPIPLIYESKTIGMKLVLVPAGEFDMGTAETNAQLVARFPGVQAEYFDDERPQHHVRITQPFYLGQYEVTVGQFGQFVEAQSYRTEAERDGKGGLGIASAAGRCESLSTPGKILAFAKTTTSRWLT